MSPDDSNIPINPFRDIIVKEPRRIESAVAGLNDVALKKLLNEFNLLADGPCPRLNRQSPCAQLVSSVAPGYGKSHLIGRLFKELQGKATLIYLKPFQDPSSCWRSLLDKIVMELECPDRADAVACAPGELSQLDAFSRRVLAFLLADLTEKGFLNTIDKDRAISMLTGNADAFFEDQDFLKWLSSNFVAVLGEMDKALQGHGIQLSGGRQAWLKVLFAYAISNDQSDARQLCLNWVKHQPLEVEEATSRLKLRLAEIPEVELPYEQRNEKCFERIVDLLGLASYYRPFAFCFDQTELFGHSQQLANSFGAVIARLVNDGCNLFMVVAANKVMWDEKVSSHFDPADRQRIFTDPIVLSGINNEQGKKLVRNRLSLWPGTEEHFKRLTMNPRFDKIFQGRLEVGIRDFLLECYSIWEDKPRTKLPSLFELFAEYRAKLLASPKSLRFDAGVLQWIFQTLFDGRCRFKIRSFISDKGYFVMKWEADDREMLFGFEEGNNFKRWQAINSEGKRYYKVNRNHRKMTRIVLFRVPNQSRIPGERWQIRPEIESTIGDFFSVFHLSNEEIASLYAAHDLYADVVQGNQEADKIATLDFLSDALKEWVERVSNPPEGAGQETVTIVIDKELIKALQDIVSQNPFITLDMLQQRLVEVSLQVTKEQIFAACERISQIKVFISPTNAVFKWIS